MNSGTIAAIGFWLTGTAGWASSIISDSTLVPLGVVCGGGIVVAGLVWKASAAQTETRLTLMRLGMEVSQLRADVKELTHRLDRLADDI